MIVWGSMETVSQYLYKYWFSEGSLMCSVIWATNHRVDKVALVVIRKGLQWGSNDYAWLEMSWNENELQTNTKSGSPWRFCDGDESYSSDVFPIRRSYGVICHQFAGEDVTTLFTTTQGYTCPWSPCPSRALQSHICSMWHFCAPKHAITDNFAVLRPVTF